MTNSLIFVLAIVLSYFVTACPASAQSDAFTYITNVDTILAMTDDLIREMQKSTADSELLKKYAEEVGSLQKVRNDLAEQIKLIKKEPGDPGWMVTSLGVLFMLDGEVEGTRCAAITNRFQLIQMGKAPLEQGILSAWAAQIKTLKKQIVRTYALGMIVSVNLIDKDHPRKKPQG